MVSESNWITTPLKKAVNSIIDYRGKTPKKLGMEWENGDILALSANNVKMGKIDSDSEANYGSETLYKKWMKEELEKGDVLMTMEAPLGNVTQVPDNQRYILSQRVVAFKTINEIDNDYFKYYLMSSRFQNLLYRFSSGTTAKGISQKNLKPLSIAYPPKAEQQKIAAILSSVDEAIEKTEQIIDQTEQVKKGLMQQLLTKGIGHKEFKETSIGDIPENWKIIKFGDVFEISSGLSFSRSQLGNSGYFYLHYGDIHKTYKHFIDIEKDNSWIPRIDIDKDKVKEGSLLREGDLVISDASEDTEGIGKSVVVKNIGLNVFISGLHTIVARDLNNVFLKEFNGYLLLNSIVRKQIRRIATGATVYGISKANLKEIYLPVPPKEEQRIISNLLVSVDEKIEKELVKKKKLNFIKQGLMQQLLTGKVRVPINDDEEVIET
ncbi:restriction endonuclease subunit S [Lentibacillus sp.]|uniref:restriction endonuclease subunit S n=1 Tax=Lentibacillus sp. TaxID=1925746 RepID=UPI002B4AB708|nr:restriction endonuclease subunit S [Lentibacillus sp.]HLS09106.1 restriction endonuclease subunit S [Lentibacillus sp.]